MSTPGQPSEPGPGPHGAPGGPQQPGPTGQQPHPDYPGQGPRGDDRALAVLAHLSPLIALVLSAGFLSFLGPLLVWLIWRERGELVRNASASAFNFNLTVWLASIIAWICVFTVVLIPLAIVLWAVAGVAQIALSILGAVRANKGVVYRYPFQVPVLR